MATSLGQLLDELADTAERVERSAADQADAATALGHLGRALAHLRDDGLSTESRRGLERDVAGLATACSELGRHAPVAEGRMALLAGAAADSMAVLHSHSTVSSRWAVATLMADTVTPLAAILQPAPEPAAQRVEQVRRWAVRVQQTAALHPPSRSDASLLDRPLAGFERITSRDPVRVVPDAVAALLRATGATAHLPTVAQVLTYTSAAETITALAQRLGSTAPMGSGHLASPAWRAVREALRPYDDGSRRPHPQAPPAVAAAIRLNDSLTSAPAQTMLGDPAVRGAVAAAAQHMPTLAVQLLYRTVRSWADDGSLVAFARDLPPREERMAPYLRGYQPGGLVRANAADLQPVVGALHNARLLSLAVAVRIDEAHPPGFPHRVQAANQEMLRRPEAAGALEAASREAARQVLLGRQRHHGQTRPR
ncbi:hypothetical protein [Klenkia brasiliensis]|uniref:Uncharacterized protein n=1 Tax=Klenkia brasiliensis TaxID=333142 RepID=A0A1G7SAI4_9ACTN|nr:hypothetical protein [Klenkia brasiliensis]SDG20067.1 hypothetical protein SAMN05660324_1944 [Klenkia brasiliensis]